VPVAGGASRNRRDGAVAPGADTLVQQRVAHSCSMPLERTESPVPQFGAGRLMESIVSTADDVERMKRRLDKTKPSKTAVSRCKCGHLDSQHGDASKPRWCLVSGCPCASFQRHRVEIKTYKGGQTNRPAQ
jgi:hypothetical protein